MKCVAIATLLVLCTCAPGVNSATVTTKSPVEQVVKLLKDLTVTLVEDQQRETKIYNRYACWCEKATTEKAKAIHDADDLEKQLAQEILTLKERITVLNTDITDLEARLAKARASRKELDDAASKANQEYMAQSTEYYDTLTASEKALMTLTEAVKDMHDVGLVQAETQAELHAKRVRAVRSVLKSVPLSTRMGSDKLSLLAEFSTSDYRYAPQSMTIQGILRDMYETTASDLQEITSLEADRNKEYEIAIEANDAEIADILAQIAEREKLKAQAQVELAQKEEDYNDNLQSKKVDIKFFDTTKTSCTETATIYTQRKSLRDAEIEGVKKAYEELSSEDARAKFAKAMQGGTGVGVLVQTKGAPSFLQLSSNETSAQAAILKAYDAVRAQARSSHSIRLAVLAMNIRMGKVGHFQEVIEKMDTLVATLKAEGLEDITKRDECVRLYKKNNETQEDLKWKIKNNNAIIADLTGKIAALEKEREMTIQEKDLQNDNKIQLTSARNAAHEDYVDAKADDNAAIELLKNAKKFLAEYYENNGIDMGSLQGNSRMVLAQQKQPAAPVFKKDLTEGVEADFSSKDSRALAAKGAQVLMQHLIEDIQDEILHGDRAEAKEVKSYQEQYAALEEVIQALQTKIDDLIAAIDGRKSDKTDEEALLANNVPALESAEEYKARITPDCDWIIGAIKERADKRNTEIRGLQETKEYLAGKLPSVKQSLIQNHANEQTTDKDDFSGLTLLSK